MWPQRSRSEAETGGRMNLTAREAAELKRAIGAYDYPKVLFDFRAGREITCHSMRDLEKQVRGCLLSRRLDSVKEGLSNILYWGLARVGYREARIERFRSQVTDEQLRKAQREFRAIEGTGLQLLKRLGLPQFSHMSFLSKVRMFLDPREYVVLDLKLMKMAKSDNPNLFSGIKRYPTYVPVTRQNETVYERWCEACRRLVASYFDGSKVFAADVERGIFQIVQEGNLEMAGRIVEAVS